jgi:hypothetical protein
MPSCTHALCSRKLGSARPRNSSRHDAKHLTRTKEVIPVWDRFPPSTARVGFGEKCWNQKLYMDSMIESTAVRLVTCYTNCFLRLCARDHVVRSGKNVISKKTQLIL